MAKTDKETDEWGITRYLMRAEMMQRYSSAEVTAGWGGSMRVMEEREEREEAVSMTEQMGSARRADGRSSFYRFFLSSPLC